MKIRLGREGDRMDEDVQSAPTGLESARTSPRGCPGAETSTSPAIEALEFFRERLDIGSGFLVHPRYRQLGPDRAERLAQP